MCGIYGFQLREKEKFSPYEAGIMGLTLAEEMEGRGRDSFGTAIFTPRGNVEVIRGLGRVTDNGSEVFRKISESRKILGHTRAATVGAISVENSHPFEIGNIVGVHNGGVGNYDEMNKQYDRTFQVDSQHIFAHINEDKDLFELSGYGTVFYADRRTGYDKIRFFKTNGGVITVGRFYRDTEATFQDNNHFMIAWASEYNALDKCAKRLGLQFHSVTVIQDHWYYIENGEVYKEEEGSTKFRGFSTWASSRRAYSSGGTSNHYKGNYDFTDEENDWMHGHGWQSRIKSSTNTTHHSTTTSPASENDPVKLTKRQRKALRNGSAKVQGIERGTKAWEEKTADPMAANITPAAKLITKSFQDRVLGSLTDASVCGKCDCLLRFHMWGECMFNKLSSCKAMFNHSCQTLTVKICRDCGHFLAEDIHAVGAVMETVWCNECSAYCIPDAELEGGLQKLLTEATEGDESTALVVMGGKDSRQPTIILTPNAEEVEEAVASFINSDARLPGIM